MFYLTIVKQNTTLLSLLAGRTVPCTFEVYDCRQRADVSRMSHRNPISCFYSGVVTLVTNLPSLIRVMPQAFGALGLNGPLYMTSYLMFTCIPFSFQYVHASTLPAIPTLTHQIIFKQQQLWAVCSEFRE